MGTRRAGDHQSELGAAVPVRRASEAESDSGQRLYQDRERGQASRTRRGARNAAAPEERESVSGQRRQQVVLSQGPVIPMITELEISPVMSSSRSFIPTLRLSLEAPGSSASIR